MTPIQIQRVARLKRLHHLGKISLRGLHQQMNMIRQQTVTKQRDFLQLAIVKQFLQVPSAIEIVSKNLLPIVASTKNMVSRARIFDAKRP
jgi:hypothetical protein